MVRREMSLAIIPDLRKLSSLIIALQSCPINTSGFVHQKHGRNYIN